MNKKVVFLGTPDISSEFLEELVINKINICGVITQPDKPYGRKKIITPPPVKLTALKYNLEVYQPASSFELKDILEKIMPDLGIVVAYGRILKSDVLNIPSLGFYNIHFSLLPAYRGADPVRFAILNMETKTGITIFKIDEGMDTGPILISKEILIDEDDTTTTLMKKMVLIGKKMMMEAIELVFSGKFILTPQSSNPSYTRKIKVEDSFLDFSKSAREVYAKIRAFSFDPYSRFVFTHSGKKNIIQVIKARYIKGKTFDYKPGSICGFEKGKGIFVKCFDDAIFIESIKPEGKNVINAYDYFINGLKLKSGDIII